ncbi:hypothetical protein AB3464_14375 [Pseudomonas asplenii]|uniref:WYL domain-containing protein n=1 Tax=Pseudomonas asplenii TaxID=53407 RepID=A0A1H6MIP5_9PSED|nr:MULTISPECIES: hypothetical protein [Pseudomonas]UZE28741.1 hypothetical protein LOY63_26145 [Pseudomonas asplenii]SEH97461.1 hypothetical protein SAMN05216581_0933 [Pseudomonas fuscovaginae]
MSEEEESDPNRLMYFKVRQKINVTRRTPGVQPACERGELCSIDWSARILIYCAESGLYRSVKFDEIEQIDPIASYRKSSLFYP